MARRRHFRHDPVEDDRGRSDRRVEHAGPRACGRSSLAGAFRPPIRASSTCRAMNGRCRPPIRFPPADAPQWPPPTDRNGHRHRRRHEAAPPCRPTRPPYESPHPCRVPGHRRHPTCRPRTGGDAGMSDRHRGHTNHPTGMSGSRAGRHHPPRGDTPCRPICLRWGPRHTCRVLGDGYWVFGVGRVNPVTSPRISARVQPSSMNSPRS